MSMHDLQSPPNLKVLAQTIFDPQRVPDAASAPLQPSQNAHEAGEPARPARRKTRGRSKNVAA